MLHRSITSILLVLLASPPAFAATARLLGPGSQCLGAAGAVAAGAALRLEACDGAADQVWELPPQAFSGVIQLGGFCLDGGGGAPQLAACGESDPFQIWRHDGDGQLAVAGRCLDASLGLGFAPCTGAAAQLFFAEGHNAWTPAPASRYQGPLPLSSPDPDVWYTGGSYALRRSENGGRTWGALRGSSDSYFLTVSPFDPDLLWHTTPSVERSADGGRSWTTVLELQPDVAGMDPRVVPSLRDPQRVYAFGASALWASHDGGRSFEPRGPLPLPNLSEMTLLDLGGGNLLFLRVVKCLFGCPPESVYVYRSADEGASWQEVLTHPSSVVGVGLVGDPFHPANVYLKLRPVDAPVDQLLRSTDGGLTFERLPDPPSRDGVLLADRARESQLYLVQGQALWRSRDGGLSWHALSSPLAGLDIYDSRAILFGDRGLRLAALVHSSFDLPAVYFDSEDGGDSFVRIDGLGNGNKNSQPLPVVATSRRDRLYFRDSFRLLRTDDGGRSWQPGALLFDTYELLSDPREPSTLFARHYQHTLSRSVDAGASFVPLSPPAEVNALAVFAHGGQTVVLAASFPSFFRSLDGGSSWATLPSPQPAQHFVKLAADADTGAVYAVTDQRELYRSLDGGLTFVRRGTAEESLAAGGGLLAYCPYAEIRIKVSTDGGATFVDRFPPEALSSGATVTLGADGTLYVAGWATVLRSRDGGRTWRSLGRDLVEIPFVRPALTIDPFDSAKLYHSGALGVWQGRWNEDSALDLGERFEARLRWRDYLGQTGVGLPQALTHDTGLFWLFTPERAEVSVKLLDGRAINGRFWVFLASMTDVELDLEVKDRVSGELWTYHNPLGRLLSFGDLEAFPQGAADPAVQLSFPSIPNGWLNGAGTPVVVDERFEIEVEWNTGAASGMGLGRSLNHDSAAFYFFHPSNVELLVNVLDGRPINGKYWVYFGSLSDVEYTVRVKDRVSGIVKTYFNPAGRFASVSDTEAFE